MNEKLSFATLNVNENRNESMPFVKFLAQNDTPRCGKRRRIPAIRAFHVCAAKSLIGREPSAFALQFLNPGASACHV